MASSLLHVGSFSCSIWDVSCGIRNLIPQPGMDPGLPALGAWATLPSRKSPATVFPASQAQCWGLQGALQKADSVSELLSIGLGPLMVGASQALQGMQQEPWHPPPPKVPAAPRNHAHLKWSQTSPCVRKGAKPSLVGNSALQDRPWVSSVLCVDGWVLGGWRGKPKPVMVEGGLS